MKLSIIIPTYNEKENIQILLKKIQEELKRSRISGEVIVVDDNSPDGTGQIVETLRKKYKNLVVIHRKGKLGLSSAVLEGFSVAKGDVLAVMDSDLSHPPEKIKELFDPIRKGQAILTIGSRYVAGGKINGWNLRRKLMSKGATILAKLFTTVKDPMSGFFMIKKSALKGKKFNPKGFKILLEIILKADHQGKIKEIPITFIDRKQGKSKAGMKEVFRYLGNLFRYVHYIRPFFKEMIKFGIVGLIGTVVNLAVLYSLTTFWHIYYMISAIVAFILSSTSNYLFNKVWTFQEKLRHKLALKYAQFFIVSLAGLGMNLGLLYVFTELFHIHYLISQVLAIIITFAVRYALNRKWTFGR